MLQDEAARVLGRGQAIRAPGYIQIVHCSGKPLLLGVGQVTFADG